MKVGTDGVLLGAWCQVGNAKRILDIGTGSGVIALMLAQRSSTHACVDAIEISELSASQAAANVQASPWPDKVQVIPGDVKAFQTTHSYDLIVSNPPYFSNSLLPPNQGRMAARHDGDLSFLELVAALNRLLNKDGTFCLILPVAEATEFRKISQLAGLHLSRLTKFQTRAAKPPERELMAFVRNQTTTIEDTLLLYDAANRKSEDYLRLTGDFYL